MTNASDDPTRLRVCMYNIGFGDCFLFYVPCSDGQQRLVLVDFGQHMSGRGHSLTTIRDDIERRVRAHYPDTEHPHLDVVIATHRHFDHIAGYALKDTGDFEVDEVWLPWTEHPTDPDANAIRDQQLKLAMALDNKLDPDAPERRFVDNALAFGELSNADAMDRLLNGFQGTPKRRFLPLPASVDDDRAHRTFETTVLPGVTIHVLGPSRDPEIIADMKPPPGEYYEFVGQFEVPDGELKPDIFAKAFHVDDAEYAAGAPHLHHTEEREHIRARAEFDAAMAATGLEDAINGTSLLLILEFGSHVVVLGGDAEWGSWSVALEDSEWVRLMQRTTLYKVSHHGSYNGTPKRFVETHMPDNAVSLVSLMKMKKWPSIPRESLLDDLERGSRSLVRSDSTVATGGVVTAVDSATDGDPLWIEVSLPQEFSASSPLATPGTQSATPDEPDPG